MAYFCLSPCLVYTDQIEPNICTIANFIKTLQFIYNFLDINLCLHTDSLYSEQNWFKFPFAKLNKNNMMQTVGYKLLHKMIINGEVLSAHLNTQLSFNGNYLVVDDMENSMILSCIENLQQNVLLFVGESNCNADDKLEIDIGGYKFLAYTIKNPYYDTTGNFDKYISNTCKKCDEVFPYRELCQQFTSQNMNTALFHSYGDVIAKRNGYSKMPHNSNWYKDNAPHYIREDKAYIIVLDDVHGAFEVFDNTKQAYSYKGEFGFDGQKIISKTSKAETHKLFR